jgi:voltage-gated potassium channel
LYCAEANFEGANIKNIADSYWYSVVTLTTVGYGDFYPLTFWGRLIGFLFVLGSLGLLGLFITELSIKVSDYIKKRKGGYFGTTMENHCIIIGWNSFSKQIAEQVIKANKPLAIVTAHEADIEVISQLYPKKECFVLYSKLDYFENLLKVNIEQSRRVYLSFEKDTDTLVYTINLKKRFKDIKCVIALDNIDLKSSFNFLGVQFVIPKSEIVSKFIASYIFEPNVALLTEDLVTTSDSGDDLDICEMPITRSKFLGMSYLEAFIAFKKEHNVILVGISRNEKLYKNPKNDLTLTKDDILLYITDGKTREVLTQIL